MTEGQFDQIVVGGSDGFIELELQHVLLFDFDRILDGQNLLVWEFQPGKMVHKCGLTRADWTRKR